MDCLRCIWYFKDTNSKANHNLSLRQCNSLRVYLIFQRYKFKSKSQQWQREWQSLLWCIWYFKDTNSKANHNRGLCALWGVEGVFDISKIQIQKQITTIFLTSYRRLSVYLIFQRNLLLGMRRKPTNKQWYEAATRI